MFRYEVKEKEIIIDPTFDPKNLAAKKTSAFESSSRNDFRRASQIIISQNQNNRYSEIKYNPSEKNLSQPAGSNFELIYPEVGVTIIEGNKIKGGDKDFFKKYNRYSKNDYQNMLKESIQKNYSSLDAKSRIGNIILNQSIEDSSNLPQLPTMETNVIKVFNNYPNQINPNDVKASNSLNMMESIKLSNKLTTSLKSSLDNLDYVHNYEEKLYSKEKSLRNLGGEILDHLKHPKNRHNVQQQEPSLEVVNKFNYSIIYDSSWGSKSLDVNLHKNKNLLFSKHKPSKKELTKEMGSLIVNTKLPRSRIFNKINL